MSGGSWDYAYVRLEEIADRLEKARDPLRRAFGARLQKCAEALHDIEWVDSADCAEGDEVAAIRAALEPGAELKATIREGTEVVARLTRLLKEAHDAR